MTDERRLNSFMIVCHNELERLRDPSRMLAGASLDENQAERKVTGGLSYAVPAACHEFRDKRKFRV